MITIVLMGADHQNASSKTPRQIAMDRERWRKAQARWRDKKRGGPPMSTTERARIAGQGNRKRKSAQAEPARGEPTMS